jgi:hypothetical protein
MGRLPGDVACRRAENSITFDRRTSHRCWRKADVGRNVVNRFSRLLISARELASSCGNAASGRGGVDVFQPGLLPKVENSQLVEGDRPERS